MKLHLPLHFVSSSSHSFTSHHVSIFKCQERIYKISQKDPMNNDGCAHIFLQRLFFYFGNLSEASFILILETWCCNLTVESLSSIDLGNLSFFWRLNLLCLVLFNERVRSLFS